MKGSVYKRCQCRDAHGKRVKGCKKSHGSWAFTVDIPAEPTSRRRQVVRSGFRTRDEAQDAMIEHIASLTNGTWTDDRGITVGDWLTAWLAEASEHNSPKTMSDYRGHIRNVWLPALGRYRLRDLRRTHVEKVLRDLAKPITGDRPKGNVGRRVQVRKPRTVAAYRRTLRTALAAAQRRGLIATNPAEGRMDSIPRFQPAERAIWELEETAQFLEHIAGEELAPLFEVAAYAGLRRGELCGLRWSDLDADGGGLTVRQTVVEVASKDLRPQDLRCPVCGLEHKGRLFKAPKSAAGWRWVPLAEPALDALRAHRIHQRANRKLFGLDYTDHDLVFAQPNGDPLRPGWVTKEFSKHVTACGLPLIQLHTMRHGACSLLLAGGVPIDVVQLVLGHSSSAVTRAVYRHMLRSETAKQLSSATELLTRHRQELAKEEADGTATDLGLLRT